MAVLALAVAAASASAVPTTLDRTIGDRAGDNRLEFLSGERYLVRETLAQAQRRRARRRRELIFFGQLTDTHVIDEESPLRPEFLDRLGNPFTSAYRPQEGMTPQVLNEMVRRIRRAKSPITGRPLKLVMTTGDNTDNTQLNETRWYINLLDGRLRVNPDSGVQGTCNEPRDGLYDGVRGGNQYYEPNRSGPGGGNTVDGPGYSPNEAENRAEAGRSSEVRDFPAAFEDMNRPFQALGLGVPWYGIFGNHDGLVQGNQPRNAAFETIATGCLKASNLSPAANTELANLAEGGVTPEDLARVNQILFTEIAPLLSGNPAGFPGTFMRVPSDPRRVPLKKSDYIRQHFETGGTPDGHGFTQANVASGQGNFVLRPRRGLRFLVLDSINEGGGDGGNIDDPQFRWLHRQLLDADQKRELVMVFAHHSLQTMDQTPDSPFPRGDQGGEETREVHYGLGQPDNPLPGGDEAGEVDPCPTRSPNASPTSEETVRCLLLRHPSLIAFVNGHEHNNRVTPWPRPGTARAAGTARTRPGQGFWEINTAAHIDYPQQSRLIDLFDNRDGTLSIFGTAVDHAAPPNPGPSRNGGRLSRLIASIARELSFNDPDANEDPDPGSQEASESRRGKRRDRNVELLIRNPFFRPAQRPGPGPPFTG